MNEQLLFQFAHDKDLPQVRQLLADCGLPYADIDAHFRDFMIARSGDVVAGCVGLEVYDRCGEDEEAPPESCVLLRSLAVSETWRGRGLGKILTDEILRYAQHMEIKDVYLLTTTAEKFFAKRGFEKMPRDAAPCAVKNCTEFTLLCPDSAVLMYKRLAPLGE